MRYAITWEHTTTTSATIDVTLQELSTWAASNLPLRGLVNESIETPAAEQIERSLQLNVHLRNRLLQLRAATAPSEPSILATGTRVVAVEESSPAASEID